MDFSPIIGRLPAADLRPESTQNVFKKPEVSIPGANIAVEKYS